MWPVNDSSAKQTGVPGLTLAEIAELVGGRLEGDGDTSIRGIGPVDEVSGEDQVAFLATKRYARFVPDSRAGAYLVASELESYVPEGVPCVVVDDAYPALCTVLFMGGAGGSLRAGVTVNPVRLTRSVRSRLTRVTCGGAPVFVWPGGGITLMVDERMKWERVAE